MAVRATRHGAVAPAQVSHERRASSASTLSKSAPSEQGIAALSLTTSAPSLAAHVDREEVVWRGQVLRREPPDEALARMAGLPGRPQHMLSTEGLLETQSEVQVIWMNEQQDIRSAILQRQLDAVGESKLLMNDDLADLRKNLELGRLKSFSLDRRVPKDVLEIRLRCEARRRHVADLLERLLLRSQTLKERRRTQLINTADDEFLDTTIANPLHEMDEDDEDDDGMSETPQTPRTPRLSRQSSVASVGANLQRRPTTTHRRGADTVRRNIARAAVAAIRIDATMNDFNVICELLFETLAALETTTELAHPAVYLEAAFLAVLLACDVAFAGDFLFRRADRPHGGGTPSTPAGAVPSTSPRRLEFASAAELLVSRSQAIVSDARHAAMLRSRNPNDDAPVIAAVERLRESVKAATRAGDAAVNFAQDELMEDMQSPTSLDP